MNESSDSNTRLTVTKPSTPSQHSANANAQQMLENLDKEKEVSEILTNLPKIANASKVNINKNNEIDEQQKEDFSENDNLSDQDDSISNSDSEDESELESSDLDEESSSTLKNHCMGEMSLIEKQFLDLRDRLHKERQSQLSKKSMEVASETAPEYLQQLRILQQQKEAKLQVAQVLRELRKQSLDLLLKATKVANSQHLSNEKTILKGKIQADIDEKIRRLEEDRNNVDTEYWLNQSKTAVYDFDKKGKKIKKKEDTTSRSSVSLKRKRKPVTVTGPYIVYMLKDSDIVDDWAAIKRAVNVKHRKTPGLGLKKRLPPCQFENGKFHWNGKLFMKGQNIVIRKIIQSEVKFVGTIVNLSATEILIRQNNGKKSKLRVDSLQKGKYCIQHR